MKKLFVTFLALAAMCLAPASYANCGHCPGDKNKDGCVEKSACTDDKTCSDKVSPDKARSECGTNKGCSDSRDGKKTDPCQTLKASPEGKDSKACDTCKTKKGSRRHRRGWFRRGHGHSRHHNTRHHNTRHYEGTKVSLQPMSVNEEASVTPVSPVSHQAAQISTTIPAAEPVAGVVEKTGTVEVTHYGAWGKVDKVLFRTGDDVFKLLPTRESHHQLQEIKQYNGKTVNVKGEVCRLDRHHTEPSIKVHSISESK